MASTFSISLGNWLYKNAFGVYNLIYPIFKNRQDANEIALLKKFIQPGDTVLDIGANIGFYSQIISKLVGDKGKVICFEPDETNFKHLQKNTAGLSNVQLEKAAVSEENKVIKIYLSKDLNVDHRTYPVDDFDKSLEINAVCIDEYLGGASIDFIKMDIQGYEIQALKGMRKTLTECKKVGILMEFWPHGLQLAGSNAGELLKLLDEYGLSYRFVDIQLKDTAFQNKNAFDDWDKERYTNLYVFKS